MKVDLKKTSSSNHLHKCYCLERLTIDEKQVGKKRKNGPLNVIPYHVGWSVARTTKNVRQRRKGNKEKKSYKNTTSTNSNCLETRNKRSERGAPRTHANATHSRQWNTDDGRSLDRVYGNYRDRTSSSACVRIFRMRPDDVATLRVGNS